MLGGHEASDIFVASKTGNKLHRSEQNISCLPRHAAEKYVRDSRLFLCMFRQGGRFHPYHGISGLAKPFESDCVLGVVSYSASILVFSLLFLFFFKKKKSYFL